MRIVLVDQKTSPYRTNIIQNGTVKAIKCQLPLIADKHDVFFMTSKNSENYENSKVETVRWSLPSRDTDSSLSSHKYNDIRNKEIINTIDRLNPDIVLSHDGACLSLNKYYSDSSYNKPTAIYHHTWLSYFIAIPLIKSFINLCDNGHTIVNVSQNSVEEIYDFADKIRITESDRTKLHEYINYVQYTASIDEYFNIEENNQDYAVVVCRADKSKNVHMSVNFCGQIGLPIKWVATNNVTDDNGEYFERVRKLLGDDNIYLNKPRDEVRAHIENAKYLFIAGVETFGLSAVEGNLAGIPVVLLNKKKTHPVKEACSAGELLVLDGTTKENIQKFNSYDYPSFEKRKKFRDNITAFYSKESAYKRLELTLETTLENYRNRKRNLVKDTLASYFG